jgi:hypothetical protein
MHGPPNVKVPLSGKTKIGGKLYRSVSQTVRQRRAEDPLIFLFVSRNCWRKDPIVFVISLTLKIIQL